MQCAECLSHNDSGAAFCAQCGARIEVVPTGRGPKALSLLALFLVATVVGGGIVAYVMSDRSGESRNGTSEKPSSDPQSVDRSNGDTPSEESPQPDPPSDLSTEGELRLAVRRVRFFDLADVELGSFDIVVSGEGLLPVSRRAALGAVRWEVTGRNAANATVVDGLWRPGEKLGLWRLDTEVTAAAPLRAYDESVALTLHPLDGGPVVPFPSPRAFRDGSFLYFETRLGPGALVQGTNLVGWILDGTEVRGGWLWPGPETSEFRPDLSVEDFYDSTFEGGREEAFVLGLAEKQLAPRIAALLDAFRLPRKLTDEETPERLRSPRIINRVTRDLVTLRDRGESNRVAQLLTAEVIGLLRASDLLLLAVDTWDDAFGEEAAIGLAEQWWSDLIPAGSQAERDLTGLVVTYYGRWLQRLITENRLDAAWSVLEEARRLYPEDADIHLRGVELSVLDNDWQTAEANLDARQYPSAFADRVALLRSKISALKALEGKIIIRFPPGRRQIATTVMLNGRVEQDYIIDTGASITTLPEATARQLGIRITDATPRVRVRTAGGDVLAADVTLDGISLAGWEVPNVRVLVHDLPGNETVGLLGMNFLGKFNLDLRSDEGMLILEPR